MRFLASHSVSRALFVAIAVISCMAAFLRGNYLLGFDAGIVYVLITLALLWLFDRSRTPSGQRSIPRLGLVAALSLVLGFAMVFPATIDADFQYFIDKQAVDRAARAELGALFATDPASSQLLFSTRQSKQVIVTINGSLPNQTDFDRLRARIHAECPAFQRCGLYWDVGFRDSSKRVYGADRELFGSSEAEKK